MEERQGTELRGFLEDVGLAYVLRMPSNFALTLVAQVRRTCAEAVRALARCRPAGTAARGLAAFPANRAARAEVALDVAGVQAHWLSCNDDAVRTRLLTA